MQRWAEDVQEVTQAAKEAGRQQSSTARVEGLRMLVPQILGASRRYAGPTVAARVLWSRAVQEYIAARGAASRGRDAIVSQALWSEVLAAHEGHMVLISSPVGETEVKVPAKPKPESYLGFVVKCLTCDGEELSANWSYGGIGGMA